MDAHPSDPSGYDGIPVEAGDLETTPYDYIVIGSGAGGGPMAARLAKAGMKVLVLEAGLDPAAPLRTKDTPLDKQRELENKHLIYHCPGLHAAATEPYLHTQDPSAQTSWGFDVRHYPQPSDPAPGSNQYYYPRASAVGGCTAHHAMISVYGIDADWQKIADMTGDSSWGPGQMRSIYKRIERARNGALSSRLLYFWRWFLNWLNPGRDASGERGESGWLDVTLTDPKLAMKDKRLMSIILNTVFEEEGGFSDRLLWRWIKQTFSGMLFRDLDLNDEKTMREHPEGVALVPLGVNRNGMRRGARERVVETRRSLLNKKDLPGKLHLATGIFVRRVVFNNEGDVPRAVGVEFDRGQNLYKARPEGLAGDAVGTPELCFARREIILCGGTFNSPQVLMLSGIGNEEHLKSKGVNGLGHVRKDGKQWVVDQSQTVVNLPGVGQNLRDRCEISVITEMAAPFVTLDQVKFNPSAPKGSDPALDDWRAEGTSKPRGGLYTTNGAAIAVLKRSNKDLKLPDLLMFAFPAAFRGYYRGWSKELLAPTKGSTEESRGLWSWVILKAFSGNTGSVTLRSDDCHDVPDIQFHYYRCRFDTIENKLTYDDKDKDLVALEEAIRYARKMNDRAKKLLKGGDAAKAELQPGSAIKDGSTELRDWLVKETWGHHAAGTCRIGSDPWRSKTAEIVDSGAVLDSNFRVHGVRGLRVVDASVFPVMPGYFIAVPTYMISEKAADTILYELSY